MKFMNFPAIAAAAIALIAFSALAPHQAFAGWPESAFEAKNVSDAMGNLFGTADNTPSGKIKIDAPDAVSDGASVRVTVTTAMQASAIAIVVEKNGQPLAANFELSDSAKGFVGVTVRICRTSDVIAVIRSGGKLFTARKNVKVANGDCASYGGGREARSGKSIRAKSRIAGGDATVTANISHPMESGQRLDRKTGAAIPAHYITEVRGEHKGKTIATMQLGPAVSGNPVLSFRFAGARQGDRIKLDWVDNMGQGDSDTVKIR
jgi:thiosulfate oxidation carrier complex protein SoxZ